jgi:hypothetical protein
VCQGDQALLNQAVSYAGAAWVSKEVGIKVIRCSAAEDANKSERVGKRRRVLG